MNLRRGGIAVTVAIALALVAAAVAASASRHDTRYASPMMGEYAGSIMGSYSMTPAASATHWHHFLGTVTSTNRAHRSFWMRTTTRRSVQIYTNHNTDWNDCGWGYMRHGYPVDVRAYRSHGHWMATRMQSWHHDWMMP